MWRGIGLVVLLMAVGAAIACGGGGGSTRLHGCPLGPEDLSAFATSGNRENPTMSLEEARRRSYAGIGLPETLPDDVVLKHVVVSPDPGCPDEHVTEVSLVYEGLDYTFTITEREGPPEGFGVSGAQPFTIDGFQGFVSRRADDDGKRMLSFHWSDGKRRYSAYTYGEPTLTEERFLEILESIPE